MLVFEPVRSQEEIIGDLRKTKIEQEILKKKENMLIDELLNIEKENYMFDWTNIIVYISIFLICSVIWYYIVKWWL